MRITTTKCPDGTFYGAVMRDDGIVIAMSDALSSRQRARTWALKYEAA